MPALVIEGGANRAAYATGVLAAFQSAGFVPDAIYGTSAGGAIGAWYGAGQSEVACRTWEAVNDRRLLSYRRVLRGGHVFDLRTLYHHYYPHVFGMDIQRLRAAPYPVHVTITDADTGATYYPDLREEEDPFAAIHAGAAIPVLAEAPVSWKGRRCVDGGTTAPIPLARAIEDGHRDIVLVLNRPEGERRPEPTWAVNLVTLSLPRLRDAARRHHELHNEAVRLAKRPPEGVRVSIVRPWTDTGVTRATRDVGLIRRAIERGRADGTAMAPHILAAAPRVA